MNSDRGTSAAPRDDARPLVCHVVHRFDYGGLENGIVNLVNGLPAGDVRHAIVALTAASDFQKRIRRDDVRVFAIGKRPGKDFGAYVRLYRLFRELRPSVVHTRNVGTIDCALIASLARVPVRVHGEHGWDVTDPDGTSPKYLRLRRVFGRFVHGFVAVSEEIRAWLVDRVGVPAARVRRICNGVDTTRFQPQSAARARLPAAIVAPDTIVIGSVTRFTDIKDPLNLVRAFIACRSQLATRGVKVALVMAGDGPLLAQARAELDAAGCADVAWLPGARDDVADLMAAFDVFALGSRREGISNTVLEAMACGVPVVASATGGNLEVIADRVTGRLVPPADPDALRDALATYALDATLRRAHGAAARERALERYSLATMMHDYGELYRRAVGREGEFSRCAG
jgi:sugar transferase (PEP-CTERM/EpsH1 system associated)